MQALRFSNCDNLNVATLTHINSPKNHISITSCNGVRISNLHINAPEESPNTDGFDISSSSNILIYHSTISTGSILDYSLLLYITKSQIISHTLFISTNETKRSIGGLHLINFLIFILYFR